MGGSGQYGSHYGSGHMDQATAEGMFHQYMQDHSSGPYEMGEIRDEGSHYMTDIFGSDGGMRESLRIDKRTGNIRSIR